MPDMAFGKPVMKYTSEIERLHLSKPKETAGCSIRDGVLAMHNGLS